MTLETPYRIEPAILQDPPEAVIDAIAGIAAASATLGHALHPTTAANLADLVRLMNCYYSNLRSATGRFPVSESRTERRVLADGDLDIKEARHETDLIEADF